MLDVEPLHALRGRDSLVGCDDSAGDVACEASLLARVLLPLPTTHAEIDADRARRKLRKRGQHIVIEHHRASQRFAGTQRLVVAITVRQWDSRRHWSGARRRCRLIERVSKRARARPALFRLLGERAIDDLR